MKNFLKLCILIILGFVFLALYNYNNTAKQQLEQQKNEQLVLQKNKNFYVEKIIAYSNANIINNASERHAYWNLSINQFTDFAIYIKSKDTENENSIKNISIENIKIENYPQLGEPNFYIRNVKNIGKSEFPAERLHEENIKFEVINNEDELKDDKLQFKRNGTIPLTFGYINENVVNNYIVKDIDKPIESNGSILKRANITINSLKTDISFSIKIINNIDEIYNVDLYIELPITEELFNGQQIYTSNEKKNFELL